MSFLLRTTPQKVGKISEEEFNCASRAPFKKLDKDGGRRSDKSAFKCYGKWQTDFDDIIDGMLTFEEFAAGFDMFDTNGNGVINRDEMNAALA